MLKITGLNEFTKALDDFEKKVKDLGNTDSVPMDELLTPAFISRHTRFSNADEMFEASGFQIETQEDFEAIPDDKWDEFIQSVSAFPDWQAMLREAIGEWAERKLDF